MEDLTFAKPLNDFHPDRKACMADNPHLYNTCYTDEFRSHLEDAGFEVLEFQDTSQLWGEGCWAKSNDYYIPVLEGEEGNLERAEVRFLELFSKNKPQIYADLRHMTVEQIRERFPLTCKYVDPAHFVHEVTQDIVMVRYICKKPELSSDATTANEDMDVFYTDWKRFCELMIQREQRKKGEGVPLTWQDYQPIDNINFTGSSGISEFMKKYNPGPVIIDVGAGMGGTCRHFAQEFNATPIGIEYTQSFIDLGNQISRDLGLPEYIRWGDASEPLGIENADAAYSLGVLNALPRELKTTALKRVFDAVKPGGLLFIDDLTFSKPLEEFHPDRKAGMVSNPHLFNTTYTSEFRQHLEDAGWQVLEYKDVSQIWGEGCWAKSNDFYLPILEEGEDSLERAEVRFLELLGKNKPTIYADLRHMTVEEIRERYPLTSKYVDPAHYVHEVAQDIVMVRYICRRPE